MERGKGLDLAAGGAALLIIETCRRACLGQPLPAPGTSVMKRLERAWQAATADGIQPGPAELARRAGRIPKREHALASSPMDGRPDL